MSPRQEIKKSRISFRIFPTACISHHIGGGVTEPIFCKQIAPARIRSVQYIHILSTSRSRQQELRNISNFKFHLELAHSRRQDVQCPQSNICQISFSALVGGLGKEQKLLGNFEDWFYFAPLSPPLLPFTVAKKEKKSKKYWIGHFMSISANKETTWCSFNWHPTVDAVQL